MKMHQFLSTCLQKQLTNREEMMDSKARDKVLLLLLFIWCYHWMVSPGVFCCFLEIIDISGFQSG
jgi:hypothetical protein